MSEKMTPRKATSYAVAVREAAIDKPMHFVAFALGALGVVFGGSVLMFTGAFVMGAVASPIYHAVRNYMQ